MCLLLNHLTLLNLYFCLAWKKNEIHDYLTKAIEYRLLKSTKSHRPPFQSLIEYSTTPCSPFMTKHSCAPERCLFPNLLALSNSYRWQFSVSRLHIFSEELTPVGPVKLELGVRHFFW